jgi:predicted  nucleic acid-binding Zn-ribbon protein
VTPQKKGVKVVKKKREEVRTADMVEADIAKAEQLLASVSEQMGTPEVARDAERLKILKNEYQQAETRLRVLYEEWDRVNEHQEPANV